MSATEEKTDLERTEELFAFLQGRVPEGYGIKPKKDIPKLSADQAWTVIWYLGNQYWQVTDHVERCCVCGDLYESWAEGACLDYGKAPYHFCDPCMNGPEFREKAKSDPEKRYVDSEE